MSDTLDEIFDILEKNPAKKRKFIELLTEEDPYARKSDLTPILEELADLKREQIALRQTMDKRFEAVDKRFEAVDKRFEAVQKTLQEQIDILKTGFSSLTSGYNKLISNVERMGGLDLEMLSLSWFQAVLRGKGLPYDNLRMRRHFDDPDEITGSSSYEIDLFQEEPLLAVEVTAFVNDLEKINKFIRKLDALEKKFGQRPEAFFITNNFAASIEQGARALLQQENIGYITTAESKL